MENYYVYIYLDPHKLGQYCYRDLCFLYEPFYVGKGKNNRYLDENSSRNNYFKNKINRIKKLGLKPVVVKLYENLNEDQSFKKEIELINEIGRKNLKTGSLVNMTDGGEGSNNRIISKETKIKMSCNHANFKGENHPNFGKHHLKETIKKLSEKKKNSNHPLFGKHHSEKTKSKISEKNKGENNPMFGKHHSEEIIKKMKRNKGELSHHHKLTEEQVIQIKLLLKEGKLTQKEIADIFGVDRTVISMIKRGKTWSHVKI